MADQVSDNSRWPANRIKNHTRSRLVSSKTPTSTWSRPRLQRELDIIRTLDLDLRPQNLPLLALILTRNVHSLQMFPSEEESSEESLSQPRWEDPSSSEETTSTLSRSTEDLKRDTETWLAMSLQLSTSKKEILSPLDNADHSPRLSDTTSSRFKKTRS